MHTIKLKGLVDKDGKLSLTLPPDIPVGMVDVIVVVEEREVETAVLEEDSFAKLMAFHKGHRLDGVSLMELTAEGRR